MLSSLLNKIVKMENTSLIMLFFNGTTTCRFSERKKKLQICKKNKIISLTTSMKNIPIQPKHI